MHEVKELQMPSKGQKSYKDIPIFTNRIQMCDVYLVKGTFRIPPNLDPTYMIPTKKPVPVTLHGDDGTKKTIKLDYNITPQDQEVLDEFYRLQVMRRHFIEKGVVVTCTERPDTSEWIYKFPDDINVLIFQCCREDAKRLSDLCHLEVAGVKHLGKSLSPMVTEPIVIKSPLLRIEEHLLHVAISAGGRLSEQTARGNDLPVGHLLFRAEDGHTYTKQLEEDPPLLKLHLKSGRTLEQCALVLDLCYLNYEEAGKILSLDDVHLSEWINDKIKLRERVLNAVVAQKKLVDTPAMTYDKNHRPPYMDCPVPIGESDNPLENPRDR